MSYPNEDEGPDEVNWQEQGKSLMSQRADHARARKSLQDPILIQGVWLDASRGRIRVSVEVNGIWHNVIDEYHVEDMHTSHIVEPDGIRNSKPAAELG
jgi:hypothetical protein